MERKLTKALKTQGLILHLDARRHVNWAAFLIFILTFFSLIKGADSISGFPEFVVKNYSLKKHRHQVYTIDIVGFVFSKLWTKRIFHFPTPLPTSAPPTILPESLRSWARGLGLLWLLHFHIARCPSLSTAVTYHTYISSLMDKPHLIICTRQHILSEDEELLNDVGGIISTSIQVKLQSSMSRMVTTRAAVLFLLFHCRPEFHQKSWRREHLILIFPAIIYLNSMSSLLPG